MMTHSELCFITAQHFASEALVALWEYQSPVTAEFPDVLVFGTSSSTLFEIKTSHSDFLADLHKDARAKWKNDGYLQMVVSWRYRDYGETCIKYREVITKGFCKNCDDYKGETKRYNRRSHGDTDAVRCAFDGGARLEWVQRNPELYYIEKPHLGNKRYYICEKGLISPKEVPAGWGLYWYNGGRFYLKKESGKFKVNMYDERNIAVNAIYKMSCGDTSKIVVDGRLPKMES